MHVNLQLFLNKVNFYKVNRKKLPFTEIHTLDYESIMVLSTSVRTTKSNKTNVQDPATSFHSIQTSKDNIYCYP